MIQLGSKITMDIYVVTTCAYIAQEKISSITLNVAG